MVRYVLLLRKKQEELWENRAGNTGRISRPELLILHYPICFFFPC